MADSTRDVGGEAGELPTSAHVGRVALRVGAIDPNREFYEDVIGFVGERNDDRLELGSSTDEPLLVLETAPDAPERPHSAAGLFHVAIRVPDRAALGDAVTRIRASNGSLSGASDHLVSEALYLRDPEGNGVELYCDRPREEWPFEDDGRVDMQTLPLDSAALEAAGSGEHVDGLPIGTDIGHVHLEVTHLPRSERFYRDALGLRLRARYGDSAAFLAAGDYHHHVGLNTWNHRTSPAGDHRGLAWWEFVLTDQDAYTEAATRIDMAGHPVESSGDTTVVVDPDGIELRLVNEPR